MLGAVHKNVLPVLAVNSDNPKQPLLVFPYSNKGNLKRLQMIVNGSCQRFMADCLQIFAEMPTERRKDRPIHTEFSGHVYSDIVGSDVSQQSIDPLSRSCNEKLRVS